MSKIYCGNNALHDDLSSGEKSVGTRYQCFQKGIGKGLRLPLDKNYLGSYQPIDDRKVYCGKKDVLPRTHDIMGNSATCLQKGVGIGKKIRASHSITCASNTKLYMIMVSLLVLFAIGIFLYLYYKKPRIILSGPPNKQYMDVKKFIAFYIPSVVLFGVVLFLITLSLRKNIYE